MSPPELSAGALFYSQFAEAVSAREKGLGHPVENCPTASDLWDAVKIVEWICTSEETASVSEIHAAMRVLANVNDKWVDPDGDPIGAQVYGPMEELIASLQKSLSNAMPETAETLQKWNDLRALLTWQDARCFAKEIAANLTLEFSSKPL